MREIKFRGYSKSFNIMFDYDMLEMASAEMVDICNKELKVSVPESTNIQMGLFLPTEDEDLALMQYTGLKDKNGKEIYEGDIVEVIDKYAKRVFTGEVSFIDASFVIKNDYSTNYRWMDYDVKVIGNIYENPELMEE